MEENEPTAQASSSGQPRAMDKSLIKFLLYMKSKEENRGIIMYIAGVEACSRCGEDHLMISEFHYHYN